MAEDSIISELTELTSAASTDIIPVVDVSDDTDGATGTTKKITKDNLLNGLTTTGELSAHTGNTNNPHQVTKTQVGLGNVDNTSDLNKPVSTATQTALNAKSATSHTHTGTYEPANANIQSHISSTENPHSVTKTQVGLGNVDNTSDLNKPVSTATSSALSGKSDTNHNHDLTYEAKNANIQSHISSTSNPHSVTAAQAGAVPTSRTVNSKALSANVTLTTADIADSTDKRYVTEAEKTKLSNTSGTNTGDQVIPTTEDIQDVVGGMVASNTESGISVEYDDTSGKLNFTVTASGSGDVTGPASAVGDNLVTFNSTTGKIIKDSGSKVADFATASHNHDSSYVPGTRTVNSKALSANITLSTTDIADSTNKRYVSDAQLTVIGNTSGTNTGDQDLTGKVSKTGDTMTGGLITQAASPNNSIINTSSDQYSSAGYYFYGNASTLGNNAGVHFASNILNVGASQANFAIDKVDYQGAYKSHLMEVNLTDNSTVFGGAISASNLSGTNTGDQTLPVKASGAEINTGTDDAKFATSKAIADSNLVKNPMTTAGDIIVGGTSGAPARLAMGAANKVLKVNSGGTAVEWGDDASASYTDENAQDAVGGMVDDGTTADIAFTYDDATPKLSGKVKLRSAPGADTTISGPQTSLTAGAALAFGDVCYMGSDGKMEKGDADAVANAFCWAMAIASISEDAAGLFALPGSFVRNDAWNWATLGQPVYLDTATAGGMTQTAPSGTDDVIQIIGIATHADRIFFYPQLVMVEHT